MNDNERIVTENSSKYLLGVALGILAEPTASDEERDAMVHLFERWNPAKYLTPEDAAKLRAAMLAKPEYAGWHAVLTPSIDALIRQHTN